MNPVRKLFKSNPAPRPVVCDLVHFPEIPEDATNGKGNPEYWTLRLYRDNFESFSAEDKLVIFNWVSDVVRLIRMINPHCYVEVFERMPS